MPSKALDSLERIRHNLTVGGNPTVSIINGVPIKGLIVSSELRKTLDKGFLFLHCKNIF